jgi:HSP20 family protein
MIKFYRDPFNELLGNFFETQLTKNYSSIVKLNEDETHYNILVSVPGLTKEDLSLSINDNVLLVSFEENKKTFSFTKSFTKEYYIPDDVSVKDIDGKVENGVLSITLPKIRKKKLERTILLN